MGRVMVIFVPFPSLLSGRILPWWSVMMRCTIESPNPVPFSLVVKYGLKIFGIYFFPIPLPVSLMMISTVWFLELYFVIMEITPPLWHRLFRIYKKVEKDLFQGFLVAKNFGEISIETS